MSKTMIITDTCCDLPASLVDQYDVEILATAFNIDDRILYEGIDFSQENFYEILPAPKDKIKNISIPAAVYLDRFKNAAACGFENVIVIMTGDDSLPMHRTATEAIDLYKAQNPTSNLRIEIFNTENHSMATGLLVITAAKLAQDGHDIDEILATLASSKSKTTFITDKPDDSRLFDDLYMCCAESLRADKPDFAIGYASRKIEARALAMLLEEELGYAPIALYKLGAISAYTLGKDAITFCFKS